MPAAAEELFAGHPDGLAVYRAVAEAVRGLGECTVPAVLSIALPAPLDSARVKQVVHPAPRVWMHHLELQGPGDVDDEARDWLRRAYEAAG